jgi:branched-chain amino acid transport system permease protein
VFGLAIILFLMVEPRGIAALWLRVKAYFLTWPFRY